MINPKPTASLSSGLLARKGQARPAMRPQGFLNLGGSLDDLGWNDMGDASVSAPAPAPAPVPPLRIERPLDEKLEAEPKPLPPEAIARLRREVASVKKGKAAFTLRLDAERHLRLRLASAVSNRSAQQLVTEALDNLLETMADVEKLATQVVPAKRRG